MLFYYSVRVAVFDMMIAVFSAQHAEPTLENAICQQIDIVLNEKQPPISAEAIAFLGRLYRRAPDGFTRLLKSSLLLQTLVNFNQRLNWHHADITQRKLPQNVLIKMAESRLLFLSFFGECLQHAAICEFLFRDRLFVGMLFGLLFCIPLRPAALNLLSIGFRVVSTDETRFHLLFDEMQKLFKEALRNPNHGSWVTLIQVFLQEFASCLDQNRSLLPIVDQFNWLADAAMLGKMTDNVPAQIEVVNCFLRCCLPITTGSPYWRKKLSQLPMRTIIEVVTGKPLGDKTVDLFLSLVFECDIALAHLPPTAEIANQKI
jgi:hypothetical protein